ncbi:unnamed protein product [Sympodiomycopsis kandeliae]
MAWLPPNLFTNDLAEKQFLGYPLIGREIALGCTGASVVLAAQYFFLHGDTDPRWLVCLAAAVEALTFLVAVLLVHVSWISQLISIDQLRQRFMWEYVVIQPARMLIQSMNHGYLIYRYRGLGKSCQRHRIITAIFTVMCVLEALLDLAITILTMRAWRMGDTIPLSAKHIYFNGIFGVYQAALYVSALLNFFLTIAFCWKLWKLKTSDDSTAKAIKFVIALAMSCGLCTAAMILAWAIWFAAEQGNSYRLLVELGPAMYACQLFLSLMSRERIRQGLRNAQGERHEKALQRFSEAVSDTEEGMHRSSGAFDPQKATISRLEERRGSGQSTMMSGQLSPDVESSAGHLTRGSQGLRSDVDMIREEDAPDSAMVSINEGNGIASRRPRLSPRSPATDLIMIHSTVQQRIE